MKYVQELLGTRLTVEFTHANEWQQELFGRAVKRIREFENTYSRFLSWNFLEKLNREKKAPLNSEFRMLLELAKKVSLLSQGYFDITIRPFLENRGYGIEKNMLEEVYGSQYIELIKTEVLLHHGVSLDVWAIGKGYMIDTLYNIFSEQESDFIIDFGGDIRVKWSQTIELEDPYEIGKSIGNIEITNRAIAASSGAKRKFGKSHHLINPKNPDAQGEIVDVYTMHRLALFADTFSTALFVSPVDIALKMMRETKWLSACIILRDGTIHKNADFNAQFYTLWSKK